MGVVGTEVVVSRSSVLLLDVSSSDIDEKSSDSTSPQYVPNIRSGSFSDIGRRRYMEDEHINIDDLSSHLHLGNDATKPSGFFGVFDGHGGSEASAYVREHIMRLFFKDSDFLENADENDDAFLEEAENCLRNGFLLADSSLADASSVNSSSGTTALTALVVGRLLMVANAGDCRAVLSRKGESINMSQDHRPTYGPERRRVESLGGYIEDGYLNGVLSVTRALGDWDMKMPCGAPTPLIAEPEIRQIMLTEEDEFLIIGCDGIWDVISSQQAVSIVRRGLRRHDDPEQCAKDLVMEALHRNTFDNVTVVIVCFSPVEPVEPTRRRMKWCSLSSEALCSLKSFLE